MKRPAALNRQLLAAKVSEAPETSEVFENECTDLQGHRGFKGIGE